jgi:hypothetical protein
VLCCAGLGWGNWDRSLLLAAPQARWRNTLQELSSHNPKACPQWTKP